MDNNINMWSPSDDKKEIEELHLEYPWEIELDPTVFDVDNWF